MNRRTLLRSGAFLLAAGALVAANGFGIASAHEHRTVGDYELRRRLSKRASGPG